MFHVRDAPHAVVLVKKSGLIVDGIHNQEMNPDIGLDGSDRGIRQEAGAKTMPLKSSIYGEPSDEDGGKGRVARQLSGPVVVKIPQ